MEYSDFGTVTAEPDPVAIGYNSVAYDNTIIIGGDVGVDENGNMTRGYGIIVNCIKKNITMSDTKISKLECEDIKCDKLDEKLDTIDKKLDRVLTSLDTLPQVVGHHTYKANVRHMQRTHRRTMSS